MNTLCPDCGRTIPRFMWPHGLGFCSECLVWCVPVWTREDAMEDIEGAFDPMWLVVPFAEYMPGGAERRGTSAPEAVQCAGTDLAVVQGPQFVEPGRCEMDVTRDLVKALLEQATHYEWTVCGQ